MNNKFKLFVAFGVSSVIALALCLAVLIVTVNNLDSNIISEENKTIINKTELDSSKETLVKYINKLILSTDDRFVKTKIYTGVSVNDIKVLNSSDKQSKDEALLNFAKDRFISVIDSYYAEDFAGSFEKNDSKKLHLVLSENELQRADYSIGQVNENGESVFDNEGNLVDEQYYYLSYIVDVKNKLFNKETSGIFSIEEDISAKKQFVEAVKESYIIETFDAKPTDFIIKAKVNRENDKIECIDVIRNYAITVKGEFLNDVEFLGEKEISFIYAVTDTYEYSYAGISLVEDEIKIDFDEEYMLNVKAVIDNDSEYTVEFSSSDESVVTVDEMGYIKVLKNSEAPVTITVKLNYLGETFIDTCIVNVSGEKGGAVDE